MIRILRQVATVALVTWMAGFVWFSMALPQPAGATQTDAVVVLTGGAGRIDRGAEALRQGWAAQLFVSGVDRQVRPREFAEQFRIDMPQMYCCVVLGYSATDTITNARETAEWVRVHGYRSVRLVTSDWHMRRARLELRERLPAGVTIVADAVPTQPSLRILLVEYHKLLARELALRLER